MKFCSKKKIKIKIVRQIRCFDSCHLVNAGNLTLGGFFPIQPRQQPLQVPRHCLSTCNLLKYLNQRALTETYELEVVASNF